MYSSRLSHRTDWVDLVGGEYRAWLQGWNMHAAWPLGSKRPRRTGGEVRQESSNRPFVGLRGLKKGALLREQRGCEEERMCTMVPGEVCSGRGSWCASIWKGMC